MQIFRKFFFDYPVILDNVLTSKPLEALIIIELSLIKLVIRHITSLIACEGTTTIIKSFLKRHFSRSQVMFIFDGRSTREDILCFHGFRSLFLIVLSPPPNRNITAFISKKYCQRRSQLPAPITATRFPICINTPIYYLIRLSLSPSLGSSPESILARLLCVDTVPDRLI